MFLMLSEQLISFLKSQRHLVLRDLVDGAVEVLVEQTLLANLILVELHYLKELD